MPARESSSSTRSRSQTHAAAAAAANGNGGNGTTSTKKPRGKPRGMRRDRDCRTCKARNVKCDLNRPQCLPCVEAGLACGGYPQRVVWAGESSSTLATASTKSKVEPQLHLHPPHAKPQPPPPRGRRRSSRSSISTSSSQSRPTDHPIPEIVSLAKLQGRDASSTSPRGGAGGGGGVDDHNSFINRLATFCQQIISARGRAGAAGNNGYLSDEAISLVAHLSDFVQARIHGYSSAAALGDGRAMTESMDAARHRLAALVGLNEALRVANPLALLAIAAFAFFEVYDSEFGEWQRHVYGARSLLDYHCRSRAELEQLSVTVTGLTEIVARLVWFDVLGAIARQSTGLIFDDWHREVLNEGFFEVVGCAADTFDLYVRVAKSDVASSDHLDSCVLAMDQLLRLDPSDVTDWGRSANAHRCAATIAVLAKLPGHAATPATQRAMRSAVDRACHIIASTPSSSPFYIFMAVTAYLAGLHATTDQQRNVVRGYWQSCTTAGVPRYPCALAKCEATWASRGVIPGDASWSPI